MPRDFDLGQIHEVLSGYRAIAPKLVLKTDPRCCFEILEVSHQAHYKPVGLVAGSPRYRTLEAELSREWPLRGRSVVVNQTLGEKPFVGLLAKTQSGVRVARGYLEVGKASLLVGMSYPDAEIPFSVLSLVASLRESGSDETETSASFEDYGFSFTAPMSCTFLPDEDNRHRQRVYLASWNETWMIRFGSPSADHSPESAALAAEHTAAIQAPALQDHYGLTVQPKFAWQRLGNNSLYATTIAQATFTLIHGFVISGSRRLPFEITLEGQRRMAETSIPQTLAVLKSIKFADENS